MGLPRPKSRFAVPVLACSLVLCLAGPARADVGEKIVQRCTHGESLSGFSPGDYAKALKELSADAEEYTDCSSLIRKAQLAAAGGGAGGGPAGGGGAPMAVPLATTPTEQKALARAAHAVPASVPLGGGEAVRPGVVHANIASALSSLPAPLLAIVALLLACVAAAGGGLLRNRVRARRAG